MLKLNNHAWKKKCEIKFLYKSNDAQTYGFAFV